MSQSIERQLRAVGVGQSRCARLSVSVYLDWIVVLAWLRSSTGPVVGPLTTTLTSPVYAAAGLELLCNRKIGRACLASCRQLLARAVLSDPTVEPRAFQCARVRFVRSLASGPREKSEDTKGRFRVRSRWSSAVS